MFHVKHWAAFDTSPDMFDFPATLYRYDHRPLCNQVDSIRDAFWSAGIQILALGLKKRLGGSMR